MCPRKLSNADKSEILKLYRHPEETTSTLADRYGVSNSTISRILKSNLEESEYEGLIQQKRSNRTPGGVSSSILEIPQSEEKLDVKPSPILKTPKPSEEPDVEPSPILKTPKPPLEFEPESSVSASIEHRRRRKRSSLFSQSASDQEDMPTQLQLDIPELASEMEDNDLEEPFEPMEQAETRGLEEFEEDLMDLDEEEDEDLEDDLEDDDLEDDDLEDDWDDEAEDAQEQGLIKTSRADRGFHVQVLPLSEASLPKTCYVVVDKSAELIARPLREFSDLGRIPAEEVQEKTLPVFDNHRVAKRFSNRSQRVIKVPDGRMFQKTCPQLQAKGITRLLIDGQVYSILSNLD